MSKISTVLNGEKKHHEARAELLLRVCNLARITICDNGRRPRSSFQRTTVETLCSGKLSANSCYSKYCFRKYPVYLYFCSAAPFKSKRIFWIYFGENLAPIDSSSETSSTEVHISETHVQTPAAARTSANRTSSKSRTSPRIPHGISCASRDRSTARRRSPPPFSALSPRSLRGA